MRIDESGLSISDIAYKVGISDTWIHKCMKRGITPRPELLVKIAAVINCHPYDLLGTTDILGDNAGIIPLDFRE